MLAGLPGCCGRCASGACAFSGGHASARQVARVDASPTRCRLVANGTALPALFLPSAARAARRRPRRRRFSTRRRHDSPRAAAVARPVVARHPLLGTATAAAAAHFGAAHQARAARGGGGGGARRRRRGCRLRPRRADGALLCDGDALPARAARCRPRLRRRRPAARLVSSPRRSPRSHFVLTPSIALLPAAAAARARRRSSHRPPAREPRRPGTRARACALALAAAVGVLWYVERRAPWAWVLQDVLGATLCCSFLRTLSLPSLRVGAVLEGAMFCYDIFMVFVSPAIFHASVMMTVATAGAPTASIGAAGVCERSEGEKMPMLLLVPRLLDGGAGRRDARPRRRRAARAASPARRLDPPPPRSGAPKAAGPEVAERRRQRRAGRRRAPPTTLRSPSAATPWVSWRSRPTRSTSPSTASRASRRCSTWCRTSARSSPTPRAAASPAPCGPARRRRPGSAGFDGDDGSRREYRSQDAELNK